MTDEELASVIADGIGTMPGFTATFTPEEIDGVATFVAALAPAAEATTPQPLDAPPGEAIFLGNCAECHGAFGEGDSGPVLAGNEGPGAIADRRHTPLQDPFPPQFGASQQLAEALSLGVPIYGEDPVPRFVDDSREVGQEELPGVGSESLA